MIWIAAASFIWLAFNAVIAALLIRRYVAAQRNLAALEAEHEAEAELMIAEALAVCQLRQELEEHGVEGLIEGRQS